MTSVDGGPERGLTGTVDPAVVHSVHERVDQAICERLQGLRDLSATASDVLDLLGVEGAVGASEVPPTMADRTVIGPAVTVRKVPRRRVASLDASRGEADMGEIEGANQANPGDVLVIEGLPAVSAMGGLMATMAKRQGVLGAVIDGGVRDVAHARSIDFPVWSSDVTPVTGKWRSEVAEVNGPVTIRGRVVHPGDLVIADETGVVFVPRDLAGELADRVETIGRAEDAYREALAGDIPLDELIRAHRAQASSGEQS